MKGYDTAEYAGTRLIETIILYQGRPVKVSNCLQQAAKKIWVAAIDIENGATVQDYLDNFDMNPPPLGYVNTDKNCTYMTRMPMRKDWKQGLRKNNIISHTGYAPDIAMKYIAKTIMGIFPSLHEVIAKIHKLNALGGYKGSLAFDRNFAIDHFGRVWYKNIFVIGVVDMKTGGIKVDPAYEWTREALMEVVGEIA